MQSRSRDSFKHRYLRRLLMGSFAAVVLAFPGAATGNEDLTSLITDTPEEGFELAIKLSQKGVVMTQRDADVRMVLRGNYANDPNSLIHASHVVAVHFQTIAEANDYWREE